MEWFHIDTDETSTRGMIIGSAGRWQWTASCDSEGTTLAFYSHCPVNVPTARRAAVAEYLTRVSYGLVSGNFEMDLADGEVRYKTSLLLDPGQAPTRSLVERLVCCNFARVDDYLPGLMAVMYEKQSPQQAAAEADAPQEDTTEEMPAAAPTPQRRSRRSGSRSQRARAARQTQQ